MLNDRCVSLGRCIVGHALVLVNYECFAALTRGGDANGRPNSSVYTWTVESSAGESPAEADEDFKV